MAYNFEVAGPEMITPGDGHRYFVWTITETDVGESDQWSISSFPRLAALTLVQGELTDPDLATTMQTELSMEPTLDATSMDYVAKVSDSAAAIRLDATVRCGPGGTLHGRSNVDAHADIVTTRITAVLGHAP